MDEGYAYIKICCFEGGDSCAYLVRTDNWEFTLKELQDGIQADTINIINCRRSVLPLGMYKDNLLLVIDDNGKINHKPVSQIGSLLYGNPYDCIVGDCIIGWDNPLEDCEPDIYPMPYSIAQDVYTSIVMATT